MHIEFIASKTAITTDRRLATAAVQTVARLLSPEGLVVGISYAPWLHE